MLPVLETAVLDASLYPVVEVSEAALAMEVTFVMLYDVPALAPVAVAVTTLSSELVAESAWPVLKFPSV
jgi:hypothetical protein